ncbi:MAG: YidC/Oxa1 family membrane protein insertase [Lachnospiraceae bacterium]|nr:YidC/Oxa1 family membrane protein insertase [Lachnospiraceae bacterium]
MFLTQQGGFIIKPIAKLFGLIFGLIYNVFDNFGIVSIGFVIIIFTILIRLCLIPLMFKSNKSSKITAYIQPEMNKITKKYKGKKDQESMMAQQREMRDLQEKYGVNMTGSCLTALIQMPIFLALYRVIQNVPAYVGKVKDLYINIAESIHANDKAIEALNNFKSDEYSSYFVGIKSSTDSINGIIDVLAKFPSNAWDDFKKTVTDFPDVISEINKNQKIIVKVNSFIGGIDLSVSPSQALRAGTTVAILIPILSLLFQFLSMKATPQQSSGDPAQEQSMKMMKGMMYVFPIMSFFITFTVPAGLGLYWATGSFISFLTSVGINAYFKHCDMDKLIEKSKEKAAIKIAKRKASGKKSFMERMNEAAYGSQDASSNSRVNSNIASQSLKSYSSNTMSKNNNGVKYRQGSLAAKANVMQRYNDKNGGND